MMGTYHFYFAQQWWLTALLLLVPVVWLAHRSLGSLGRVRRILAVVLRCLLIFILVAMLARLTRARRSEQLTLIAVVDRSLSIPAELQQAGLDYLEKALTGGAEGDQWAVVDIAEAASISTLPTAGAVDVRRRNTTLTGQQSRLADGIQMAMAIAPPNTAVRILLISEGNETGGDLKAAARIAATNKIPIDVLALQYRYDREVIFKRLAAPARARSGQTVSLRFILDSTMAVAGKLFLNLNDKVVDLAPDSPEIAARVNLQPGVNVKTISLPVGTRGMHEFEAVFVPDEASHDMVTQNNRATALTFVSGPGHVLVLDTDGAAGPALAEVLRNSDIDVRYSPAAELPDSLARLMDTDAVILVNTDAGNFSFHQQEMLNRYVTDLGGGLVMVGGPESFGAGGWISSPIAEILPVDLDPPQKKQLPKGALVLIMHACEMPQGNFWGKKVAIAGVKTLSRLDLVGILAYNWQGNSDWVYPLGPVGDKEGVLTAIKQMQMGDMPDLGAHLQAAYNELKDSDAAQKHVIVISDGDPAPPTRQLLNQLKAAGITCTGVGIFPHSPADVQSLRRIAQLTGGRFYNVLDPQRLPQIFITEAQVVRRTLIVEETFTPQITYSLSEITRGLGAGLPNLDGYVLTGPKGGLNQMVLASDKGDPILATCQAGLGRCVAFTSSADSRWASSWLTWGGNERFWEQVVRWAGKPAQASDCEVMVDVQGRSVNVNIEAVDAEGKFIRFAGVDAQIIEPDMSTGPLELTQVGPGQHQGSFQAVAAGSYVVNLRYRKVGEDEKTYLTQTPVTVPFAPEFRDLSDNAPLLAEVSAVANGRRLPSDPNQVDLFDRANVKFPETQLLMTRPLMWIWLVVFLLDVAVRRIAFDIRAFGRRIVDFVRSLRVERKADKTIERLKLRRKKVREQLKRAAPEPSASKRYEAGKEFAGEMPTAKVEQPEPVVEKPAKEPKPTETEKSEDQSHIQQLLKAKRKATGRRKDNKPGTNE